MCKKKQDKNPLSDVTVIGVLKRRMLNLQVYGVHSHRTLKVLPQGTSVDIFLEAHSCVPIGNKSLTESPPSLRLHLFLNNYITSDEDVFIIVFTVFYAFLFLKDVTACRVHVEPSYLMNNFGSPG